MTRALFYYERHYSGRNIPAVAWCEEGETPVESGLPRTPYIDVSRHEAVDLSLREVSFAALCASIPPPAEPEE